MSPYALVGPLLVALIGFTATPAGAQLSVGSRSLAVFTPLVGRWQVEAIGHPTMTDKDGFSASGEAKGEWMLGGQFFRIAGFTQSGAGRVDYQILMTYDKSREFYRRWVFQSDGVAVEFTGDWDEDARTMRWRNISDALGVQLRLETQIHDVGFDNTMTARWADGTVLINQTWKATPMVEDRSQE